jgi:Uma2 family endonuclease
MTFAEFERVDEVAGKLELLNGELLSKRPTMRSQGRSSDQLFCLLRLALEHSESSDGMIVCREMGYCLSRDPDTWLQPDISITHPNQALEPPAREGDDDYYLGAPLLVFEMVSASDTALQLQEKVNEYLAHGAAEVWVMYQKQRDAWVYSSGSGAARHETQSIHSDLLPGIEITFDKIFV